MTHIHFVFFFRSLVELISRGFGLYCLEHGIVFSVPGITVDTNRGFFLRNTCFAPCFRVCFFSSLLHILYNAYTHPFIVSDSPRLTIGKCHGVLRFPKTCETHFASFFLFTSHPSRIYLETAFHPGVDTDLCRFHFISPVP